MEQYKFKKGLRVEEDPQTAIDALLEKRKLTNSKAASTLTLPEFVEFMRQRLNNERLSAEEEKMLPFAEMLNKSMGEPNMTLKEAVELAIPKQKPSPKPELEWKVKK